MSDKNREDGSFWSLTEGRILASGFGLFLLLILFLGLSYFIVPSLYQAFTAVSISHFFFGRAAGISVGLATGLGFWGVVFLNFFIELIMVLITYPLFILSMKQLLNSRRISTWMQRSHQAALKYRPSIQKYGVYGLFLFVWFPFWMTGPVVGSLIGYLMGLRHRVTLSAVLGGTFVANVCWGWFMAFLEAWASGWDERASWVIVLIIVTIIAIGTLLRWIRHTDHP
jgi:uncharacterized membrane protein